MVVSKLIHIMKYHVKLLFLGMSGVGKTSLIRRWVNPSQMDCEPTFAIDVLSHSFNVKSDIYRIRMSDTSGKEYYETMFNGYIYNSNAIVLVYDTTDTSSWEKCKTWIEIIQGISGKNMQIYLIGNKIDKESKRIVYKETVEEYIRNNDMNHIFMLECSAKTGECCKSVYQFILESMNVPEKEISMEMDYEKGKSSCIIV